ncbi:MAG: transposase [Pseudomonadota bacterium]
MPRKRRCYVPGVPAHIVQRGNDRQAVFFDDSDYATYLSFLRESAERYGCAVHAFVLMTNHVHLLMTPHDESSISRVLQHLGSKYVTYVNHTYKRSGTLWEGRHKGSVVDSERYALVCSRYIELNPVRAGMVLEAGLYRWSSFRRNARGETHEWLVDSQGYRNLGTTAIERQKIYGRLFEGLVKERDVDSIRTHLESGTPLGSDRFRREIESMIGRKLGYARRGRPAKKGSDPF